MGSKTQKNDKKGAVSCAFLMIRHSCEGGNP
jgi:hypothetical protein